MLKEIIENNNLTMVFQNSKRLRTGKFYRRNAPDLAVQWLIDAYKNIPSQAENIVVVPVMISYDRIYETNNVTSEMVKSRHKDLGMLQNMKSIQTQKRDQLGDVFVKYLEPIYLKKYFVEQGITETDLIREENDGSSFKLSNELYLRQDRETPITLNSLISAVALANTENQMSVLDMIKQTTVMYNYIRRMRNTTSYMQVSP